MHDMQIGRFIQVDPLAEKYAHNSTYAFSENKVTGHIELEGLEAVKLNDGNTLYGPWSPSIYTGNNNVYTFGTTDMLGATINMVQTGGMDQAHIYNTIVNNYGLYDYQKDQSVKINGEYVQGTRSQLGIKYTENFLQGSFAKKGLSLRTYVSQAITATIHEIVHGYQQMHLGMTGDDNHDSREFFANYQSAYPNDYKTNNMSSKLLGDNMNEQNITYPNENPSDIRQKWIQQVIVKYQFLNIQDQQNYQGEYEKAKSDQKAD